MGEGSPNGLARSGSDGQSRVEGQRSAWGEQYRNLNSERERTDPTIEVGAARGRERTRLSNFEQREGEDHAAPCARCDDFLRGSAASLRCVISALCAGVSVLTAGMGVFYGDAPLRGRGAVQSDVGVHSECCTHRVVHTVFKYMI